MAVITISVYMKPGNLTQVDTASKLTWLVLKLSSLISETKTLRRIVGGVRIWVRWSRGIDLDNRIFSTPWRLDVFY